MPVYVRFSLGCDQSSDVDVSNMLNLRLQSVICPVQDRSLFELEDWNWCNNEGCNPSFFFWRLCVSVIESFKSGKSINLI